MITARSGYFGTFRDLQLHIIGAVKSNSYFSYKAADYMEEHTVIWLGLALIQCFSICGSAPNMDLEVCIWKTVNVMWMCFRMTLHLSILTV